MTKKQISPKDLIATEPVEVEIGDLVASYEAIIMLTRMPFDVMVGFKISKAYREIYREVKAFEDLKDKLRKDYATEEKLENGQKKYNFGENEKKVEGMIKDEMMKKVSLKIAPISIGELKSQEIQPSILADLYWLINE